MKTSPLQVRVVEANDVDLRAPQGYALGSLISPPYINDSLISSYNLILTYLPMKQISNLYEILLRDTRNN